MSPYERMRRSMTTNPEPELNAGKAYHETSVFVAENLLREALLAHWTHAESRIARY